MNRISIVLIFIAICICDSSASAQSIISTIAGNGTEGYSGDGGIATNATMRQTALSIDTLGNIYLADFGNNVIRKISAVTGIITTIAGNGTAGFAGDGGAATAAEFMGLSDIYVSAAGDIFICDGDNERIRKIDAATGTISTIAGNGTNAHTGDGGPATNAALYTPNSVTGDIAGNIYVSELSGVCIRKIEAITGIISTFAGTGIAGYSGNGGPATNANLYSPQGLCTDKNGDIYFADGHIIVRKVSATTGNITNVAGNVDFSGPSFDNIPATVTTISPSDVYVDTAGNIFITETRATRKVTTNGIMHIIAGGHSIGYSGDGGPAIDAQIGNAVSLTGNAAGYIYISDHLYSVIRQITPPAPSTSTNTLTPLPLNIYPNPALDHISVSGLQQQANYTIMSLSGISVQSGNVQGSNSNVGLHNLPSGVYLMRITDNGGGSRAATFSKI